MSSSFGELLELELECWCHGLTRVQGRVDVSVLHEVIQEFAPVLGQAIEELVPCNIISITKRLLRASRCRVSEKEIAFYLLSHLPLPKDLNERQIEILNSTIESVENVYSGAFSRLRKKWDAIDWKNQKDSNEIEGLSDFGSLSFPTKTAQTSG